MGTETEAKSQDRALIQGLGLRHPCESGAGTWVCFAPSQHLMHRRHGCLMDDPGQVPLTCLSWAQDSYRSH